MARPVGNCMSMDFEPVCCKKSRPLTVLFTFTLLSSNARSTSFLLVFLLVVVYL